MSINKMTAKIKELKSLQALIEEAEAEAEALKDQIKNAMGDSEELRAGEYKVTYKTVKTSRFDSKSLKAEIRDRDRTAIPALLAYKIYSAYTPNPLTRLALWGVLEQAGTIRPRTETPQEVSFWGQSSRVIYINSDQLKERS